MRTGLVIEGGGVRGIYSAGVMDVFLEQGITFEGVLGVSAGAIHGCSFVSGQKGRSIRYYRKYVSDPRFMGIWSLIRTGSFVGEKFCYHDLPERLDPYDFEAFNASSVEFYAGCTNVETGNPEYLRITDMKGQHEPYFQGWMPIWKGGPHEHRPIHTPVLKGTFTGSTTITTVFLPKKKGQQ